MKFRLFLGAIAISTLSYAQDVEKIRLQVRVINSLDGTEIKNAGIKVAYRNQNIPLKSDKKRSFYEILKGGELKVVAEAGNFYSETQSFDTELLYDEDILEIKLNPKSFNSTRLAVVDSKSNTPLIAQVELNGLNQNQKYNTANSPIDISVSEKGEYQLSISADGYQSKKLSTQIDPSKDQEILVSLDPLPSTFKLLAVNKENGQEITSFSKFEVLGKNLVWEEKTRVLNAEKDQKITINIDAPGFEPLQQSLDLEQNQITLELTPISLAAFAIKVVNLRNNTELKSNIEVKSPSGNILQAFTGQNFVPKEEGTYEFTYRSELGGSYSHKENTVRSKGQIIPITLEITPPYQTTFVVLDQETKTPVPTPSLTIKTEDGKIANGKDLTFTFYEKHTLSYDLSAPGYERISGSVDVNDAGIVELPLKKLPVIHYVTQEYTLVDSYTGKPVLRSQLFLLDANKQPVETIYNASKGSYLATKVIAGQSYSLDVKAEGYQNYSAPASTQEGIQIIRLQPSGLQEYTLRFIDDYTKDKVDVKSLLVFNAANKEVPLATTEEGFKATLLPNAPLNLEFDAEGYETKTLKVTAYNGEPLTLRKTNYPLALKFIPNLTDEEASKARIVITQGKSKTIKGNWVNGAYELHTDPAQLLDIEISAPGYHPYTGSLNRSQVAQMEANITLTALPKAPEKMEAKVGKSYVLTGVNFEQSQTTMLPGSEDKLEEVLQLMKENPNVKIEIVGHTEKAGDERQNVRLSEFRARTVANWLFNKGIASSRITTAGKGSAEPIDANDPAVNRRIEVRVVEE
jgi:outer membrane protein OmpA-like peptidoglycan-associated protein